MTTLISFTKDELQEFARLVAEETVKACLQELREDLTADAPQTVRGLRGIMDLFGVSKSVAQQFKNTWLAPAVMQVGRVILTDVKQAQNLYRNYKA